MVGEAKMEQYKNINSLLERLNNAIGFISGFNLTSVYLFITTVIILSSSVTIGCIEAIGFGFAPVVYGSHIFYMLAFWISVGVVIFVALRNMFISAYFAAKFEVVAEYDGAVGGKKTKLGLIGQ